MLRISAIKIRSRPAPHLPMHRMNILPQRYRFRQVALFLILNPILLIKTKRTTKSRSFCLFISFVLGLKLHRIWVNIKYELFFYHIY